jgi:hypothetical protein
MMPDSARKAVSITVHYELDRRNVYREEGGARVLIATAYSENAAALIQKLLNSDAELRAQDEKRALG